MSLPGSVSSFLGSGDGSGADSCNVGDALFRPELARKASSLLLTLYHSMAADGKAWGVLDFV